MTDDDHPMTPAILFVASVAAQADGGPALANIRRLAGRRFGGLVVRWAAVHAGRRGIRADRSLPTLDDTLVGLRREGITHVAVQPAQVVRGAEFERVEESVAAIQVRQDRFERIAVGEPLLNGRADLTRVLKGILADAPEARAPGDALILVGHGSERPGADLAYLAAAWELGCLDPLAFLGCTTGAPDAADAVERCAAAHAGRAFLVPFTTSAGSTVRAAMAADGPQSWIAALRAKGIEGLPVIKGLGERDEVVAVWLEHAEAALKGLVEP
jgi:sirohydrochlorin cobaltochelatase